MTSAHTKLGVNGRVVIPVEFRRSLGLSENDDVVLVLEEDSVRLMSVRSAVARVQRLFAPHRKPKRGKSMVDELIAGRRAEAKREQRK